MKRGLFALNIFLAAVLFIISLNLIAAIDVKGTGVTGKIITGDATQIIGMNISIIADTAPSLTIISPKNNTYLINESLLLSYSTSNENAVWYNLDNSANITITSSVYFNTSQGSHTLYLYANNSIGLTSKNVTFFINSSRFIILDEEYNGSTKGSSTDFKNYPYEELQNLSNMILENTQSGKILFNQVVNLTDDENPNNNILDIDAGVNISFNRIEINSTALPNFNKSATLWLYNLTFSNPRILKDGEVCSSSVCTEESYSGGLLKFNVTSFTIYSAEETPTTTETPSTGGGGGGKGGITSEKLGFEVTPGLIQVMIKKGETFSSGIKIKNTGNSAREFKIEKNFLKDSVFISESEFLLNSGEEKEIVLLFSPPDSLKEDTYTGKIKISSGEQYKEIPVIFSLKSKIVLFDLTLNIPANYKEVRPGGEVLFQVSLFNLGGGGRADVELTYYVKDFEGNIIAEQKGIVGVETQASFSRTIKLPENIADGQYIVGANARYDHSIGTTSDIFYVSKLEMSLIKKFIPATIISVISLIILIALILFLIFYFKRKIKKASKTYGEELNRIEKRIKNKDLKFSEAAKERLKLQHALKTVEKAYEKGYITRQAYETGKLKIKKADENLKKKYL